MDDVGELCVSNKIWWINIWFMCNNINLYSMHLTCNIFQVFIVHVMKFLVLLHCIWFLECISLCLLNSIIPNLQLKYVVFLSFFVCWCWLTELYVYVSYCYITTMLTITVCEGQNAMRLRILGILRHTGIQKTTAEESSSLKGKVKLFNVEKGFGFIIP